MEVVAGGATTSTAVLRNDGDEAQRVRLEVGGRAAAWVRLLGNDGDDGAGTTAPAATAGTAAGTWRRAAPSA